MKTKEEIHSLIEIAQELAIPFIEVDGVKFTIPVRTETKTPSYVPDLKAEEIVTPLSVLDDLDDDEIKYWATPYYDEIQERKEAQKKQVKDNN